MKCISPVQTRNVHLHCSMSSSKIRCIQNKYTQINFFLKLSISNLTIIITSWGWPKMKWLLKKKKKHQETDWLLLLPLSFFFFFFFVYLHQNNQSNLRDEHVFYRCGSWLYCSWLCITSNCLADVTNQCACGNMYNFHFTK